ncbi:MAG: class I SAM-dependent methyltransferase [Deltaproteobacteria bacterium]|nr:class I SAM-dependent methyltransferase [Deltaproteobacteria bacterium]
MFTQPDLYIGGGLLQLTRCDTCSIVYLNPRLTLDSIATLEDNSSVYHFSPEAAEERIVFLMGLVSSLERFSHRRGRLLDIGCNGGLLLEAGRRLGWQVVGVELSPVAARRARADFGLEVYGRFNDVFALEPFDLIVAWHVLEHTHDPVAFLRQAVHVMRTDGVLALQVPSLDFLGEFQRRSEISKLVCAVHNFYFTEDSLRLVLLRAGLTPTWEWNDADDLTLTVICSRKPAEQCLVSPAPLPDQLPSLFRRAFYSLRYLGLRIFLMKAWVYLRRRLARVCPYGKPKEKEQ